MSGLAKSKLAGNAWSHIIANHSKANKDNEVAEAVAAAERIVLRAKESQIECKAASAIKKFQESYPILKEDNSASQTLIESFISLSSDASKTCRAAQDSRVGEIGKLVLEACTESKAEAVSRWRECAKRRLLSSLTTGMPRTGTCEVNPDYPARREAQD